MTKRITISALFGVVALMLSYIECLIPPILPVPGIKLGLSNIIILAAVSLLGVRYALLIDLLKILLSGLLFGTINSMLYSFCGGLLSFLIIVLLWKTRLFGMVGISAAGGVFHNAGQLLVASLLLESMTVWGYFPWLLLSGVLTGIVNGIIAYLLVNKMAPIMGKHLRV